MRTLIKMHCVQARSMDFEPIESWCCRRSRQTKTISQHRCCRSWKWQSSFPTTSSTVSPGERNYTDFTYLMKGFLSSEDGERAIKLTSLPIFVSGNCVSLFKTIHGIRGLAFITYYWELFRWPMTLFPQLNSKTFLLSLLYNFVECLLVLVHYNREKNHLSGA